MIIVINIPTKDMIRKGTTMGLIKTSTLQNLKMKKMLSLIVNNKKMLHVLGIVLVEMVLKNITVSLANV